MIYSATRMWCRVKTPKNAGLRVGSLQIRQAGDLNMGTACYARNYSSHTVFPPRFPLIPCYPVFGFFFLMKGLAGLRAAWILILGLAMALIT